MLRAIYYCHKRHSERDGTEGSKSTNCCVVERHKFDNNNWMLSNKHETLHYTIFSRRLRLYTYYTCIQNNAQWEVRSPRQRII